MMERVSIQEIAAILVEKNGLKKKEAEQFVLTLFQLVKEGLATDRLVKVKGLGTFKMVEIEARESVNVNTGERVVIDGHEKVSFTPDATMKELVNKPFSQFETVVLNDGVSFDDMPEETDAPAAVETEKMFEPKEEPDVQDEVWEPVDEERQDLVEEDVPENNRPDEKRGEEIEVEDRKEEIEAEDRREKIEEPELEEEYMSKKMTYISLVIAIVVCIGSFAAGYYLGGKQQASATAQVELEIVQPAIAVDTTAHDSIKEDSLAQETAKSDAVAQTEEEVGAPAEVKAEAKAEVKTEVKTEAQTEAKAVAPVAPKTEQKAVEKPVAGLDEYEKKDARIRTGAYRIVGTDHVVKVKAGETLAQISRRAFGPDMDCYVETFNGLTASTPLKEGQTIKIPKLELKKKSRKKVQQ